MKKEVNTILTQHGFVNSEFGDVFEAMSEILLLAADKLEIHQPSAYEKIEEFRRISRTIDDIDAFCDDFTFE